MKETRGTNRFVCDCCGFASEWGSSIALPDSWGSLTLHRVNPTGVELTKHVRAGDWDLCPPCRELLESDGLKTLAEPQGGRRERVHG